MRIRTKRFFFPFALAWVTLAWLGVATAAPADPAAELAEFQQYFKAKFPAVAFNDFADGLYALPGLEDARARWRAAGSAYTRQLQFGKKIWETPFINGKTFASCFKNKGVNIAQGYPYWDKVGKRVRTVEMDLIDCSKRNKGEHVFLTADLSHNADARLQLAQVTAYFYSLSLGKTLNPDVDLTDPDARKAYEEGKQYWWSRRGQWNFSCASCHADLAGKTLGNQPLSAGLGHGTGWPAQRLDTERLEPLHYRYMTCLAQMRAKPPAFGSTIYNHLELYEKLMSTGLPLRAPSMRN
jgi:sulfur-oxidizing protein SoxA